MRSITFLALAAFVAAPLAGSADTVAFVGPSGVWSHNAPQSTDPSRTVDEWHVPGDVASVTFIHDSTQTYAVALAAIETNVTTHNIKTSADKDMACRGTTAHVVEFAYGPDGHRIVINRVLVPDGTGIDTITYARADGDAFDPEVKKAETAFCSAT